MHEFDYVIVGGGSAGCALAGRLSEDPNTTVCVLEAGGEDHSVFVRAPLGIIAMVPWGLMNSWHYFTTLQKGLNGRKGFQPRGKVLGGSSSINAMVYTRGNRNDYDGWAALGNPGWSYADLLPLFKRAENSHCFSGNEYHGNSGPLHVSYLRSPSPANEAFRSACAEKGIPSIQTTTVQVSTAFPPLRPPSTTANVGTPRAPTCTPTLIARTSPSGLVATHARSYWRAPKQLVWSSDAMAKFNNCGRARKWF